MPDESGMNITNHIPASLVLGSIVFASASPVWAEGVGPGNVQLIEFPDEATNIGNLYFSGNGELQLLNLWLDNGLIYRFVDHNWVLIHKDMRTAVPLVWPSGVSDDGSVYGIGGSEGAELIQGPARVMLPDRWYVEEAINGHTHDRFVFGRTGGGGISGDGQVVTLSGIESGGHYTDSLVWSGGDEVVNVSFGLPRHEVSYSAGIPDQDGNVIAFSATYYAPINNIERLGTDRDVWVWEDGVASMVPHLDPGYEVVMRLRDVSGNGEAVIGNANGIWHRGFFPGEVLSDEVDPFRNTTVHGPGLAWIWTHAGGTQQITDSRFNEISVSSIDQNARIVLGGGLLHNGTFERFLWMRDGKLILIDNLFQKLGITIDVDWYSFSKISNDGTKLMGLASREGQYFALIVTIPDLTP